MSGATVDMTGKQPGPGHRPEAVKGATVTDARGHYEYPQAEGGALGKWFIGEVGFTRFGTTGAAVHDEYNPGLSTHVPTAQSGDRPARRRPAAPPGPRHWPCRARSGQCANARRRAVRASP
ncbi:hypothetical protein Cs7R123_63130 [Catellatospora sp. TT07R-123]|nr:hypothetical protein Cs7R123_63130 [Catellatospora sp. TT07R-123]